MNTRALSLVLAAIQLGALAAEQVFLLQPVEHARHRAAVQGQVAAQLRRGIDAELGHDDQHLELRGGDAVGFHMGVDDAVLEDRGAAEQQAEVAVMEVVRGEVRHWKSPYYCLGSECVTRCYCLGSECQME